MNTFEQREERLSHILLVGGNACLDFCNTAGERLHHAPDMLISYRALILWAMHAMMLKPGEADDLLVQAGTLATTPVYARAIALREAIYNLALAHINDIDIDRTMLSVLNSEWVTAKSHRYLTILPDGLVAAFDDESAIALDHVLWSLTESAVELFTDKNTLVFVKECPGCGWLFLDQSRNRNRTWCDMQFCGNRAKAHRHYQRQKIQRDVET